MNNKRIVSLFIVSFIAPLLLAFILLKLSWVPSHKVNHGQLLTEQIILSEWEDIKPKQWSIALQVHENCFQECSENKQKMQQVAAALGKYKEKVDLVLLGDEAPFAQAKQYTAFETGLQDNTLYLIDQFGLVVLAYPLSADPEVDRTTKQGLIKDLKKLLKFARSA